MAIVLIVVYQSCFSWTTVRTCIAAGCNNTNKDGISLHKFLRDSVLREKRVDQVKKHRDKWVPTEYSVLCSQHFEQ